MHIYNLTFNVLRTKKHWVIFTSINIEGYLRQHLEFVLKRWQVINYRRMYTCCEIHSQHLTLLKLMKKLWFLIFDVSCPLSILLNVQFWWINVLRMHKREFKVICNTRIFYFFQKVALILLILDRVNSLQKLTEKHSA